MAKPVRSLLRGRTKAGVLLCLLLVAGAIACGCYYYQQPAGTAQEQCTEKTYGLFPLMSSSNTTCANGLPPGASPSAVPQPSSASTP